MSVAFRRESDEEHKEPEFEIPIPPGPNLVTAHGKALIDAEVAALEAKVAELAGTGASADALKPAKRSLRYWQTRQASAQLAPVPSGDTVEFGTSVTFTLGGQERALSIVGYDEAEPGAGSISFTSPLARALLGAEVGDWLSYGGVHDAIEILAISIVQTQHKA